MLRVLIITIFALFCVSCSNTTVDEYQDVSPEFSVQDFFNGKLQAHGIVKNRSGKVIRHFTADIDASWEAGVGTLDESFVFNDGEQQRRVWTLRQQDVSSDQAIEERYIGTASDVIGEAELKRSGNALFLKYVLRIPYKDDTLDITVDDRMYLIDEGHLINESSMIKFGFNVGEIVLSIRKVDS